MSFFVKQFVTENNLSKVNKKYFIGIGASLFIIAIEIFIYQKQELSKSERLPRCFPTGEMFPYKDAYGRIKYDSVYHTIADFKLTDQNGNMITNHSLKDKIYIANFFFCTCKTICPRMANYMLRLQGEFKNDDRVEFLSHTVDPEHDSIPVLKEYEERNNIDGNKWHLLTGSRQELYDLSKRSYYLGVANDSPDNFEHSEKFVLVDNHRIIRGYYDGTDSVEVAKLKGDLKILLNEVQNEKNN